MEPGYQRANVSRFNIRKKLSCLLINFFKKASSEERGEIQKSRLKADLSAYEKLADWCREQKYEPNDTTNISELFIRITIKNAKEEMLEAGWAEDKINALPISSIQPIVAQYQTNVLNRLRIDGNSLIKNRSSLTYDEIVFTELDIKRDEADQKLGSWWHEYFDTSLADTWNQQIEADD